MKHVQHNHAYIYCRTSLICSLFTPVTHPLRKGFLMKAVKVRTPAYRATPVPKLRRNRLTNNLASLKTHFLEDSNEEDLEKSTSLPSTTSSSSLLLPLWLALVGVGLVSFATQTEVTAFLLLLDIASLCSRN